MSKKGFTLIELLVVVAVLALLARIVFSNLGGAREGAKISNALSFQSQTHSLLGSDLVGWWSFNEGSGTTARDISGYDNHGIIIGATYVNGVPGTGGTALNFNGSGDYVNAGNDVSLDLTHNFSMSFWIKPSIHNATRGIIGKTPGTDLGFAIAFNGDGYISFPKWNAGARSNTIPITGDWLHVIAVQAGSNRNELYIDGILQNQTSSYTIPSNPELNLVIGRIYSLVDNFYFNGLIDDVRIYSRALTASEIQTLYVQTKDNYLANE